MKTAENMLVMDTPEAESPRAEFKSTKATKDAANESALNLGWSVLHYVSRHLDSQGEPRFLQDGSPTEQAKAELFELAVEGFKDAFSLALVVGTFDQNVVNQTRKDRGLAPIS